MSVIRVNCTFQSDLLARIDAYCDTHGLTRSSLFAVACSEWLDAKEQSSAIKKNVSELFRSLTKVTSGEITAEQFQSDIDKLQISFEDIAKPF